MNKQGIGIFDSGVGGLSLLPDLKKILPNEKIIYLSDSAYAPYGDKSKTEIWLRVEKIIDFLITRKVKLIIIACNTVTTLFISRARKKFFVPFIGIEPAVKTASQKTISGNIGLLATNNTVKSKVFKNTCALNLKEKKLHYQNGNELVKLAEKGLLDSYQAKKFINSYITKFSAQKVDQLVLGCTHYPLFMEIFRNLSTSKINIISPGAAVAKQTKKILRQKKKLTKNPLKNSYEFFTTGNTKIIRKIINNLLPEITKKDIKIKKICL